MNELIVIRDPAYDRYEELLLRKNDLKKECLHLELEYTRLFGEQIIAVFRKKIECVQKKKAIEFCQIALNRGQVPDESQLAEFIQHETQEMQRHLEHMISEYSNANDFTTITESDMFKIKTIYRRIAKQLHPDINPHVQESERLKELWYEVVSAYIRNDLNGLSELEVLISKELSGITGEAAAIHIPDIEKKTAALKEEIGLIMDTDPYQYKFLLADKEAVAAKKDDLTRELNTYLEYSTQLDAMLAEITGKGDVDSLWGLN